ncbi:efflux RND transporter periplasmic adaptor subunit [Vibrio comitans]|uniref:RND superfamily efflux pump MFP component n=1 Tax=Vibrio comitans NBRC 102076 TaxID=1219078 RepID=A0A4Y3IND6_9VIBR|nr:efflux RND transporter periplasmic adaptor subunit [Vibrio comitans]GEA60602.1 RND superfamily efflux pump MFP component [Vibrio comitans NBRC 102076]
MKINLKKNATTIAITLAAAGSIFAVASYNGSQMAQAGQPKTVQPPTAPTKIEQDLTITSLSQVAVLKAKTDNYQAQVVGYGETKPRFELELATEVAGRIELLTSEFETGMIVKKGTMLAKMDDTAYQQALAQAKADVTSAQLAFLEEQREGEQAKSEWKRSGIEGEPSSPLVLREPQLASARADLANAKAALDKAQQDLDDTVVRAPFDALIISRDIQPGSYVAVGQSVATLYSVDRVEIELPLSEQQWNNLPNSSTFEDWQVTVTDSYGENQWVAHVERTLQHVEQSTRQRSVIVAVDYPLEQDSPLYPGTFVKATLSGTQVNDLWELPASAISQQGDIWTVDDSGLLHKETASKQFERNDKVYVAPAFDTNEALVVMHPLSSFQEGMKVNPSEEG